MLCSHLLADVEDVCDRIAILYGGKIQSQGRVRDLLQQTNKRQITTDAISDATVAKIKQLVADEDAECVVTSPMDKLETFFIRTVTAAQQQAQPTSGAVSTTKLGNFLTQPPAVENILDKLVAEPISAEVPDPGAITEDVVADTVSESGLDDQLLSKLAGPDEPDQSGLASLAEKVETEAVQTPAPEAEQVRKNILDRLTGDQSEEQEKTDNSQAGGSGDA